MLSIYLIALLVGGFLLAMSVLGGGDAFDADADVDVDADADADADADGDGDAGGGGFDLVLAWLPFASLRFWTFFGAFFGLTGVVMTAGKFVGPTPALIISIAVGYVCGFGMMRVIRKLMRDTVDSGISPKDLVGASGLVVLPISQAETGKIRLELKGKVIELLAETEEEVELARGQSCIVYEINEDGAAVVARTAELDA